MVYHWSLKQSVDQVDRIILFLVDDFGVHLANLIYNYLTICK